MEMEAIYIDYREKVMAYLLARIGNPAEAEDLCSDVFVKVTASIDRYDPQKASLSTWIYCITRNTLCDYLRTQHEHAALSEDLDDGTDLAEALCREETLETLADALETLSPRERELIIRRYYYGETLRSIGVRCGVSGSYIYVMHNNALRKIKKFFENP